MLVGCIRVKCGALDDQVIIKVDLVLPITK